MNFKSYNYTEEQLQARIDAIIKKQSEISDIIHILDDLDANIRKELDEPEELQLTFAFYTEME